MKNKIEYEDYKGLIYCHANKLHKISNKDLNELISEGNLIFCECVNNFNTELNTKFSSYLYNSLYYGLYKILKKEKEEIELSWDIPDSTHKKENHAIEFEEGLSQLSDRAKEIIDLIFNHSNKVKGNSGNNVWRNRITKKSIYRFLIVKSNWKTATINAAFQEIKGVL